MNYLQLGREPANGDPCTHIRTGAAYEIIETDTLKKEGGVWLPAIAYRRQNGGGPLFVRERSAFKQNFSFGHDWRK